MSKQYKPAPLAGFRIFKRFGCSAFEIGEWMAPRLLTTGPMTERPGALRRTVLVACPGSTRPLLPTQTPELLPNMKAPAETPRETEPVGIVISRGTRAEPAPIIQAFVWGAAPDKTSVPRDTRAA